KIGCSRGLTQLRSDCRLKISDDKYVAFRIARNLLRVISRLKPFSGFMHPMPNEGNRDPTSDCSVSRREINDCDHSVSRIAETKVRNVVTHSARLFAISRRGQQHDRHVPIGRRKLVPVEIDKAYRISVAG